MATQTALDLLLNMSAQRELAGTALQVGETDTDMCLKIWGFPTLSPLSESQGSALLNITILGSSMTPIFLSAHRGYSGITGSKNISICLVSWCTVYDG